MPVAESSDATDESIRRAAAHISGATGLLILAGAGMGVDSGLPDFRGNEGFWRAYPTLRDCGLKLVDIATPGMFEQDPALSWGFYGHRLELYREATPHGGFAILRRWAEAMPDGWWVSTTNVDGQFQKAGFDSHFVHEMHGTLHQIQCAKPCSKFTWSAAGLKADVGPDLRWRGAWPTCRRCAGTARPNVLMFGDEAWIGSPAEVAHWKLVEWLDEVDRLVIIEIGAGTAIPTLRHFGERLVERRGAKLVRINPREAHVSSLGAVGIALGALATLRAIDEAIATLQPGRLTSARRLPPR